MKKKQLEIIAHSGDNVIWLGFSVLLLLTFTRELRYFGLLILISSIVAALLSSGIKLIFKRERPIKDEYREYAPWAKFDMNSFPSGHLSRISSVTAVLGYFFPFTLISVSYTHLTLPTKRIV